MEPINMKHNVYKYEDGKLNFVRTDDYWVHAYNEGTLILQRNGVKKLIKVVPDREFTYSVKKTQVNARNGAFGLAKFLTDPEWESMAVKVMDACMDSVKAKKIQPWE